MNDLTTFNYETTAIRVQSSASGEPLFCLADVCKVLEISDPSNTTRQLKEEFGCPVLNTGHLVDSLGRDQEAIFITEPQLYFVMYRTRSAKAKPFRRWVDSEVLPAIRKTGRYESDILRPQSAPQTQPAPAAIPLTESLEAASIILKAADITGKQLGIGAREVNGYLAAMGYQARTAKGWELTDKGRAIGGVYLDVNKRNFNGAPIRQLKWPALVVGRVHIFRDKQNGVNTLMLLSD